MLKAVLIFPLIFLCAFAYGNTNNDSLATDSSYVHIRKRAAILSALLPGSGQIYNEIGYRKVANKRNRAWWKVPVVYAGLGACGYFFYQNNKLANLTRQEWLMRTNDSTITYFDQRFQSNSLDELIVGDGADLLGFDTYARRRDIFIFAFIGVWGLNVLDAYVDAHFVTFDVSEDLSMSWRPTLIGYKHPGINLTFDFN